MSILFQNSILKKFRPYILSVLLLPICLAIPNAVAAVNLVAVYEFAGTLDDQLGNSALTAFGPENDGHNRNNIETGFLEDSHGAYWYWKSNLARGGGFWIDMDLDISYSYTVCVRFSFDQTSPGYKKIIDYQNSDSDNGLYLYFGKLYFYPVHTTGAIEIPNNQPVDLVVTRASDGIFTAYYVVDGLVQIPAELNVDAGVSSKPILVDGKSRFGFFFDDTKSLSEATDSGKVYGIKIWDGALTAEEIQEAMNHKATLADVDIIGVTGDLINPKDVVVTLVDDAIKDEIVQNTDLSFWISNLPPGLSAQAKETFSAGAETITLEISGTPEKALRAPIRIKVPGAALSKNVSVTVAQNPRATFSIFPSCVIVEDDLSMEITCAMYDGIGYAFRLDYHVNLSDPDNFLWKMDISSFGMSAGGPCIAVNSTLSMNVTCAEFMGRKYGFRLDHYFSPSDPSVLYWKLDPVSFLVHEP